MNCFKLCKLYKDVERTVYYCKFFVVSPGSFIQIKRIYIMINTVLNSHSKQDTLKGNFPFLLNEVFLAFHSVEIRQNPQFVERRRRPITS